MWQRFLRGFLAGAAFAIIVATGSILALQQLGIVAIDFERFGELKYALEWLYDNLGLSMIAFLLLIVWYCLSLGRLATCLRSKASIDVVQHLEQRVDTIVALVFGVGVIWTAVGMRSALMYALGDGAEAVDQSAAVVLDRLVSGGMLVALSSTIAGGVLGYAMRIIKQLALGGELANSYQAAHHEQLQQFAELLADSMSRKAASSA